MKIEVFNLLLEFHMGLIRVKPKSITIDKAFDSFIVTQREIGTARTDRLENALLARQADLIAFHKGDWAQKVEVYNKNYKSNPNPAVFDALKFVLCAGEGINAAASSCGVNYQSVKVLKPRWERYVDFGLRLDLLLKGGE